MPSPWEALEHLPECFDVDMIGRVCCFSPCIEQVIKTVEKMSELGFYDIEMFEVLVKTFDMKKIATNKWGKEEIQVKDRTVHHSKNDSLKEDESKCQSEDIVDNTTMTEVEINTSSIGRKRAAEEDIIKKDKPTNIDESSREMPTTCSTSVRTSIEKVNVDENGDFILVTRPGITTRGHTSFLTFAKYLAKKIEMPIISSEPIIRSIVDEAAVSVEDSANK